MLVLYPQILSVKNWDYLKVYSRNVPKSKSWICHVLMKTESLAMKWYLDIAYCCCLPFHILVSLNQSFHWHWLFYYGNTTGTSNLCFKSFLITKLALNLSVKTERFRGNLYIKSLSTNVPLNKSLNLS